MTRFARAKGSKSSNERAPEDGTPWEVMKEQLFQAKKEGEEAKERLKAEQQRVENYENFLKEQKVQKRQATWCEFPETNQLPKKPKFADNKQKIEKKNKKKNSNSIDKTSKFSSELPESTVKKQDQDDKIMHKNGKKKNKQPKNETPVASDDNGQVNNDNCQSSSNKKKKIITSNLNDASETTDNQKVDHEKEKGPNKTLLIIPKKKNKKFIDGKPVRRKAVVNDNCFKLIINGKDVELVRFEGFPIMKRDAERLEELKNNMIKKGIPKSEVQRTIKLERRRAEKALARLKKDVCYNCRKGGHNLSDCPELKSKITGVGGADGVCFKCGSTEHRQFECKVQKDKEFRFASCFICREQGHIARQCPDNPKGLYPNGGGCKLCGDVTHLRKDCPTDQDKRIESTIKLQTLDGAETIDDMNQEHYVKSTSTNTSKQPKKITF